MIAHTPGPWRCYVADGYREIRAGLEIIGRAEGQAADVDAANAALFAAAPHFYEALKEAMVAPLPDHPSGLVEASSVERARGIIKGALAKVRP